MKRCDPVQTRKNLETVNMMAKMGLDFMPMPVMNEAHRVELAKQSAEITEKILEGYDDE